MYLSKVYGKGGIEAHCVAASIANHIPIYTLETRAPKFIDAECLTGDTLLHFERQAKPGQQCLATMSIEEFHDKWTNGITKVSKHGTEFKSKYKNILNKMRLRCYDFESGSYTTTSVVDIWESGIKKVYKITADDFEIKASENHYFLTQRGWVKVKDLLLNDSLVRISHLGQKEVPKNYLSFNRSIKPELLELQNYKCYDCGCHVDNSSDVHHIIPVTIQPELWNDKNNVVCLCEQCHTQRHVELGYTSLSPKLAGIDSIEYYGEELTYDLQVEHSDSNFVANGFVVHNCEKHRMLSSNSSSSRAIPFKPLDEIYIPTDIRKNQKGMQGYESLNCEIKKDFISSIKNLHELVFSVVSDYSEDIHKQHLNRYIEPWMFQRKVITATEWDNFFNLRLAKDAQPEIQELARCMKEAMEQVTPEVLKPGSWHLPYIKKEEIELQLDERRLLSVGRCARVSYNNIHSDRDPKELANMLLSSGHMTPFEHQATPMKHTNAFYKVPFDMDWENGITHMNREGNFWSANFRGWIQYRQLVQ